MGPLSRRDLLVGLFQALLLALFPWLRTERGVQVVADGVEAMVPEFVGSGWWADEAMRHLLRGYNLTWRMPSP